MSETFSNNKCDVDCKFQKDSLCTLEQANWAKSADGAECMAHLFENEDFRRF